MEITVSLSRQGLHKLKEWIALLDRDGWSKEDKQWLVDFWLEHHDEDGVVIALGHPLYVPKPQDDKA
jgi:hypothetical protein